MAGRCGGAGGGAFGERGDAFRLHRVAREHGDEHTRPPSWPGAHAGLPGGYRAHSGDLDGLPRPLWHGGDFLFGRFGIADAMFAPVVLRFQTYGVALEGAAGAYAEAILALPALREWVADGVAETERIEKFEHNA